MTQNGNGNVSYKEFRARVLDDLDEVKSNAKEIKAELVSFQIKMTAEIATLKVKAGIWGLIAGAIPVAIFLVIKFVS